MAKLKLDLHDFYNKGKKIDESLYQIMEEALDNGIREIEIIPGKGSGALKKHVIRFLQKPAIKSMYHRMVKDPKNHGRLFVYFKK